MRYWEWLLLLIGLSLFASQGLLGSQQKSSAFDEQYNLTAGYTYLKTGDFRLSTNHPPLMGLIGSLPLARNAINLPLEHPAWITGDRFAYSDVFLWNSNANPQALLIAARRPVIGIGLLLIIFLFFAARQIVGPIAGWMAFGLAIFDPNLIANSRVVTTDLGLTCFLFGAVWQLWCWLKTENVLSVILAGLLAGLAMGAKYTGLCFIPVAFFIMLIHPRPDSSNFWSVMRTRLVIFIGINMIAWSVVWAIFNFEFGIAPDLPIKFAIPAPTYWQNLWNTFFKIVRLSDMELDFLLGQTSANGWWYYFLVALFVKTPLPTLILTSLGIIMVGYHRKWRNYAMLWVPPTLFLILGSTGLLTIGYRHILPIIPFLLILSGLAIQHYIARRIRLYLLFTFALWIAIEILWFHPHQEAYFNQIAGHWTNWSNILVDSNLDWGQDLPALRDTMDEMGIQRVNLAYFGKAVPEVYDVDYHPLPSYLRFIDGFELKAYNPFTPEPGWYAISATSLRLGLRQPENVGLYSFFQNQEPIARAGYSIYLYNVQYPETIPIQRGQIVGTPLAELGEFLSILPERRAQIKWSKSAETEIHSIDSNYDPALIENFVAVDANFENIFSLLGYTKGLFRPRSGQPWKITLYWEVGNKPMPMPAPTRSRPLSAFVQVTRPNARDQVVAQYDGWEVALRGLEAGDIVVHPIQISLEDDLKIGQYDILVGLYSPQDWTRLRTNLSDEIQDSAKIGTLEIE